MKSKSKILLGLLSVTCLTHSPLLAQNNSFAVGDIILFVQKPGDDDTIYVGLGNAADLYRGSAAGPTADRAATNIININAQLTTAFGAGWASDTEIYTGAIACRSSSLSGTVVKGDHNRTIYASRERSSVGTVGTAASTAWDFTITGANTAIATRMEGFNNSFEVQPTTQVAILPLVDSQVDDQNPFVSIPLGIQDLAFNGFGGGIQQRGQETSFGAFGTVANAEFLLDLWRITARPDSETTGIEVPGVSQVGSFEGTIVIGADGNVSFVTVGASTPYTTWINSFNPPLTNASDRLEGADPDKDGINNLMEFVLNGNPSVSSQAVLPTLDASGSNFVFSFNRRDDSESPETTQVFQHSPDLVTWTDVSISPTPAGSVTVTENGASPDGITVTIAKGTNTKLFGRLKVVK
jgi:hypothetical protein